MAIKLVFKSGLGGVKANHKYLKKEGDKYIYEESKGRTGGSGKDRMKELELTKKEDGFYYFGGQKISDSFEAAEKYANSHKATQGVSRQVLKEGDPIKISSTSKVPGLRGKTVTFKEYNKTGEVIVVDSAKKEYTVKKAEIKFDEIKKSFYMDGDSLTLIKSNPIKLVFDLIKSISGKQKAGHKYKTRKIGMKGKWEYEYDTKGRKTGKKTFIPSKKKIRQVKAKGQSDKKTQSPTKKQIVLDISKNKKIRKNFFEKLQYGHTAGILENVKKMSITDKDKLKEIADRKTKLGFNMSSITRDQIMKIQNDLNVRNKFIKENQGIVQQMVNRYSRFGDLVLIEPVDLLQDANEGLIYGIHSFSLDRDPKGFLNYVRQYAKGKVLNKIRKVMDRLQIVRPESLNKQLKGKDENASVTTLEDITPDQKVGGGIPFEVREVMKKIYPMLKEKEKKVLELAAEGNNDPGIIAKEINENVDNTYKIISKVRKMITQWMSKSDEGDISILLQLIDNINRR